MRKYKIGILSRSDLTGLGNQSRNLARLLNPDKVMLIDSTPFNNNSQHPELYADYDVTTIHGFPTIYQIREWLKDVDVVLTCELFYNLYFVDIANELGVKTINCYNWEFFDNLQNPNLTLPTILSSPSKWHISDSRRLWGERVRYLPTPIFTKDFEAVRERNMQRTGKKRFLHVMGRQAIHDRNGTNDLIRALRYSQDDFELVIKAQTGVLGQLQDSRIIVDTTSPINETELYEDFDAMILPRRYGGQCLPQAEALCAGLPVIMTDISPNNTILPAHWLCSAEKTGAFMTRTMIDLYTANHRNLGQRIDQFARKDLQGDKILAYNIGYNEYSNEVLKEKWEQLIEDTQMGS